MKYSESGARDEAPEDVDGAGGALLPASVGRRPALRARRQDRPPRPQARQHVPLGKHDGQDRRLRTGSPTPRRLQSVRLSSYRLLKSYKRLLIDAIKWNAIKS